MRLRRTIGLSLRALFAHRLRALLAVASVGAGVAAVVLTSGLGATAAREVRRNIERAGANLLVVRPKQVKKLVGRKTMAGYARTLRVEDAGALEQLAAVGAAAPAIDAPLRVKAGGAAMVTSVRGTTPPFLTIRNFQLASGRFFDEDDDRASRRVVVLGDRVRQSLFADEDPVGRELRIRNVSFTVIGVLAPKGVLADGDEDNQVLVPLRTAMRRIYNVTYVSAIFVDVIPSVSEGPGGRARQDSRASPAATITELLHDRHRADDFEVQSAARMYALQKKTADSFTLLTTGLAAIALLVGGIGILALMLMTVRERTPEIGLRVAVGARPRDIVAQFLLESSLLALAGWVAGVLLGGAGIGIVALSTRWTVAAPVAAIVMSLAMALMIGLGFGALPARRASLIQPIEALLAS